MGLISWLGGGSHSDAGGKPLSLKLESVPAGLSAAIASEGESTVRIVRIAWNGANEKRPTLTRREVIRFRAKVGNNESLVDLGVVLNGVTR